MRFITIAFIGMLWVTQLPACAPSMHHPDDDWERDSILEPEITGDNEKDEARWRRQLADDPFGDDAHLLTDDPPGKASEYQDEEGAPPPDFVGPPAPPTFKERMQKRSTTFGKVFFSIMTVFVTLGMMAAPYLMMI